MNQEFVDYILDKAHKEGFTNCQLYYIEDRDINIHTHNGLVMSKGGAVSFEAVKDDKLCNAYIEGFDKKDADYLIKVCLENAEFMPPKNEIYFYGGNEDIDFESYDPFCEVIETVIEKSQEFTELLKNYGGEFAGSSLNLKSQARTIRIVNDKGLDKTATTSRIHGLANLVYAENGRSNNCHFYVDGSHLEQINFQVPLDENINFLSSYVKGAKPKSGTYRSLFRGETYSYLLMVTALFFSKDYVDSGKTRFTNKFGKKVASDCVTIVDNPRLEGGFFSVPFDAQGVPTKERILIENGVLKNLCCDLEYNEGYLEAGSMTRSRINLSSFISVTNLYMEEGDFSREELLKKLDTGLFITEVSDYFHRHGSDPVTGDFSMPARGFFVENGQVKGGIVDFSIEGNLYDILEKVEAVGNNKGYSMPSCLYPGMPMRIGGHASPDILISDIRIQGGQE